MTEYPLSAAPDSGLAAERLKFATLTWLCGAIRSTAGVFYMVDREMRQSQFLTYNVDLSFHHRYIKDLYHLDPLHPRHFVSPQASVVTLSHALPSGFRNRNEYFHTFIEPQKIHDVMEIFFRRDGRIVAGFSILKYGYSGLLTGEDVRLIQTVHPLIESYLSEVLAASCGQERESSGERYALTERERVMLALVEEGLSNKQIARRLGISVSTVKTHIRNILSKTHTTSRTTLLSKMFWH